jgi:hypothetical protein
MAHEVRPPLHPSPHSLPDSPCRSAIEPPSPAPRAQVKDIHELQRETSARHGDAFRNISAALLSAAANFRDYADTSLNQAGGGEG